MSSLARNADLPALAEIDRLVHEPAHMAKLEGGGYIEVKKTFKGKRPNTILRLTDKGRQAFRQYALQMKQVFGDFEG